MLCFPLLHIFAERIGKTYMDTEINWTFLIVVIAVLLALFVALKVQQARIKKRRQDKNRR